MGLEQENSNLIIPALLEEEQVQQVQQEAGTQDEIPIEDNQATRVSQRQRFVSTRLAGHEITPDNEVNEEGEFVHFTLLVD